MVEDSFMMYDADSDDEQFSRTFFKGKKGASASASASASTSASALPKQALDPVLLERAVVALERELEIRLSHTAVHDETDVLRRACGVEVTNADAMIGLVRKLLTQLPPSSKGGDGGRKAVKQCLDRAQQDGKTRQARQREKAVSAAQKETIRLAALRAAEAESDSDDEELKKKKKRPGYAASQLDTARYPAFTEDQLVELVEEGRAVDILQQALDPWWLTSNGGGQEGDPHPNELEGEADAHPMVDLAMGEYKRLYRYWLSKRAGRQVSLLRCYHHFIMDNWSRQPCWPRLPEDDAPRQLREGYKRLLKLRYNLDRARLIADRVRKREKVKRDLLRVSGDAMDARWGGGGGAANQGGSGGGGEKGNKSKKVRGGGSSQGSSPSHADDPDADFPPFSLDRADYSADTSSGCASATKSIGKRGGKDRDGAGACAAKGKGASGEVLDVDSTAQQQALLMSLEQQWLEPSEGDEGMAFSRSSCMHVSGEGGGVSSKKRRRKGKGSKGMRAAVRGARFSKRVKTTDSEGGEDSGSSSDSSSDCDSGSDSGDSGDDDSPPATLGLVASAFKSVYGFFAGSDSLEGEGDRGPSDATRKDLFSPDSADKRSSKRGRGGPRCSLGSLPN